MFIDNDGGKYIEEEQRKLIAEGHYPLYDTSPLSMEFEQPRSNSMYSSLVENPNNCLSTSFISKESNCDSLLTSTRTPTSDGYNDPGGILIYEIFSDGRESLYKKMSTRELQSYLSFEVHALDKSAASYQASQPISTTEGSQIDGKDGQIKISLGLSGTAPLQNNLSVALAAIDPADVHVESEYSAVSEVSLRDLRRLDFLFNPNEEKSVLIRRHAVLIAMDPLRAVIMADRLLLIVPDGADELISWLDKHMKVWARHHNHNHSSNRSELKDAFEARAYEALLITVRDLEIQTYEALEQSIHMVLSYFKKGSLLPIEIQEKMRTLKNELSVMLSRTVGSKNVLAAITEDEEEMALMNLTLLKRKPKLYTYPLVPEIRATHDSMEELLEAYLIDFNSLETKMNNLKGQIQSAEELVSLRLDTSRNELLIANTALSILACSIAFSAYITGVFGMNLDNVDTIGNTPNLFYAITAFTLFLMFALFFALLYYLKWSGMLPSRIQYKNGFTDTSRGLSNSKDRANSWNYNYIGENYSRASIRDHGKEPLETLIYEIFSDGRESFYKKMTLRELLSYLLSEVRAIDRYGKEIPEEKEWVVELSEEQSSLRSSPYSPLGAEVYADGEYSAVSEVSLRDLRRLDFLFNPNEEKSVLIRRHAVLIAMDPLRAVIMADRLLLIVPDGADELISLLDKHIKDWSGHISSPRSPSVSAYSPRFRLENMETFEAHAYEALLITVKAWETQLFIALERSIQAVLSCFKKGSLLPIEIQEKMRTLKNELSVMLSRTVGSKNVLAAITEDEEEMALMNLTLLKRKPKLYTYPLVPEIRATHDSMEELLEAYLIDFNSLETKMNNLKGQIQSAEELVSLRLDTSRNELLIANTALSILACSIAFAGYITGVFGMNFLAIEDLASIQNLFYDITFISFFLIFILYYAMIAYLKWTGTLPSTSKKTLLFM